MITSTSLLGDDLAVPFGAADHARRAHRHPRRQGRRRVAAVGSDHQPGAGRHVHERRRGPGNHEHLAGPDRRAAGLGERRRPVEARRLHAMLGHQPKELVGLAARHHRAARRRRIDAARPAPRLRYRRPSRAAGRAPGQAPRPTPRPRRRSRAGRRGARAGSARRRSSGSGRVRPPPIEAPPNDGMTSAWMSSTTSATLAAARRGGFLAAEAAAVERDAQVALRRHERGADVGLAGAARVVVGDHVRGVAGRRPQRAHGASGLGVHAQLEPARRPEDGSALPEHVGARAARAATSTTSSASSACGPLCAVSHANDCEDRRRRPCWHPPASATCPTPAAGCVAARWSSRLVKTTRWRTRRSATRSSSTSAGTADLLWATRHAEHLPDDGLERRGERRPVGDLGQPGADRARSRAGGRRAGSTSGPNAACAANSGVHAPARPGHVDHADVVEVRQRDAERLDEPLPVRRDGRAGARRRSCPAGARARSRRPGRGRCRGRRRSPGACPDRRGTRGRRAGPRAWPAPRSAARTAPRDRSGRGGADSGRVQ